MNRFAKWAKPGVAIAAAALLVAPLAACSTEPAAPDFTTLTVGAESDPAPQGYDPLRYSGDQRQFFEAIYDTLFDLQPDGTIAPGAVSEFSYNEDSTVLSLTLKSGITFDDGSALDADTVKANLDHRSDPELVAYTAIAPGGTAEITSVDVVSDDTVAITFAAPQAGFEVNLAGNTGMIVSAAAAADPASLATEPAGSGPYRLDSKATVKGTSYVFEKDEDDRDADSFAFDTVIFKPILNPQSRVNALVSGQVDVAHLKADTVAFARSKPGRADARTMAPVDARTK